MIKETIPQLKTLSPADRFALAVELWDEVVADPESLAVTDEQLAELDRRYAEYQSDPLRVVPLDLRQDPKIIERRFRLGED